MKSVDKMILFFFITALFFKSLSSDAGYLGSVSSGISPVLFGEDSIEVEMTSEDVIIIVSEDTGIYSADIFCSFVFTERGDGSDVIMAFPLSIRTPFHPIHYFFVENDEVEDIDWRSQFWVQVDGEDVTTDVIFVSFYRKEERRGYDWNEFSELLGVLNSEEPEDGGIIFYKNVILSEEFYYNYPILEVIAVLAAWNVDFSTDRQKFIEFRQLFTLTSDYGMKTFRLTYPLFTGASWANSIKDGRISVVFEDEESAEALKYYCGAFLPEPLIYPNGYFAEPTGGIISDSHFKTSENLNHYFKPYKSAVVWNFRDLEPIPTNFRFQSYYLDIGDVGAEFLGIKSDYGLDSLGQNEFPWSMSYVYVILSPFYPKSYSVIDIDGCDFYSNPQLEGVPIFNAEVFSMTELVERGENSSNFRVRFQETGEFKTGWSNLFILNENGLVEPVLVPNINSYYGEED